MTHNPGVSYKKALTFLIKDQLINLVLAITIDDT